MCTDHLQTPAGQTRSTDPVSKMGPMFNMKFIMMIMVVSLVVADNNGNKMPVVALHVSACSLSSTSPAHQVYLEAERNVHMRAGYEWSLKQLKIDDKCCTRPSTLPAALYCNVTWR